MRINLGIKSKIIFLVLLVFFLTPILAGASSIPSIYFFRGEGCPHCAKEEIFLEKLKKEYPGLQVHDFEVWHNSENRRLLQQVGRELGATVRGVPFTVIGDKYIEGYLNEETTGEQIRLYLEQCQQLECRDVVGEILRAQTNPPSDIGTDNEKKDNIPLVFSVPLLGEIDAKSLSLPLLTIVIGALDGFNPCAMWVLIFLIGLLLGMKNRKRMWILGITFLVASAVVYFVFMAAWLNLLLFLGFVVWIRLAIGLLALVGGGVNLREWWQNKEGTCKVTGSEKRQKIFTRLRQVTTQRSFILALGGVILLAFAVNLVELICSAGLPAVYTQVLALSNLATWQYYAYLLLYIIIFLLDDIIVFTVAMITLQLTGMSTKYSRYSNLIGGIIMIIIGILLIVKPEWLMFG